MQRHQTTPPSLGPTPTRSEEVATRLRQLIGSRGPTKTDRLPSELALSLQFSVSRATVRQAITVLERDGLLVRRHGVGTFVNQFALSMATRLEEVWDYSEMIRLSGYEPTSRFEGMTLGPPSPKIAERLVQPSNAEVLTTKDVFFADGIPVIYCEDSIPAGLVRSAYSDSDLQGPIYRFLEIRCEQRVDHNITEIVPVRANRTLAKLLQCRPGTPLLSFEEVAFNRDGEPLMYSEEYYRPEYFSFTVVRKMTSR